jgi:hypothetical protein
MYQMKKIFAFIIVCSCPGFHISAQGAYIEFKMSAVQTGTSGTSKIYFRDGDTRAEVDMVSPQMPGGLHWASIILRDNPNKAYLLNTAAKTYTEMDLSRASKKEEDPNEFEITVVGKEKADGYDCTHVKIKRKSNNINEEAWITTGVPDYKEFMNVKSKYTSAGFYKAMLEKGVSGFPVKMLVNEQGKAMEVDLVKSELRKNDPALFSLSGYTKVAPGPRGATGGTGAYNTEMLQKIQDMTPEERQKFLDELRKKQQDAAGQHQ